MSVKALNYRFYAFIGIVVIGIIAFMSIGAYFQVNFTQFLWLSVAFICIETIAMNFVDKKISKMKL